MLRTVVFEASPLPVDLEALPPAARQVIADLQTRAAVLEQTLHAQFAKTVQAQEARIAQLTELAAAQEAQVAQLAKFAAAQEVVIAELKHLTDRQEHLIAELRHARFGKKSEKLCEDERQLAFEDLEVAVTETQEAIDQQPTPEGKPRRKAARRNRGPMNQIREGRVYTDVAYEELQDIFIAVAQKVLRAMTEEEWKRAGMLRHYKI